MSTVRIVRSGQSLKNYRFKSLTKMSSDSSHPNLNGTFAVNKPTKMTSAAVIRVLQGTLPKSQAFANELDRMRVEKQKNNPRKAKGRIDLKLGHGGTLDPMATGVLIIGHGNGTKMLSQFLECTKDYEAIAIFGCSTDTYDCDGGKILQRTPYKHVTQQDVEKVLEQFRGDIMQKPPIFSALHVNGKRLYEYAREGIPLPVEIKKRAVRVDNLEVTKFVPAGEEHEYGYPMDEAPEEEKSAAAAISDMTSSDGTIKGELKLDNVNKQSDGQEGADAESTTNPPEKRKAEAELSDHENDRDKGRKGKGRQKKERWQKKQEYNKTQEGGKTHRGDMDEPKPQSFEFHEDVRPPIMHLKMTVSGGTYVRSLIHDIGLAVGSSAHMVSLTRTRQGQYALGENVIEWEDIKNTEQPEMFEKQVLAALDKSRGDPGKPGKAEETPVLIREEDID